MTSIDDTPQPENSSRPRSHLSAHVSTGSATTASFVGLVGTELARFRARSITKFVLLALVGVLLLIWAGYAWGSRPLSSAETAQQQQYYQESLADYHRYCTDDGQLAAGVEADENPYGDCAEPGMRPTPENYVMTRSSHFEDLQFGAIGLAGLAAGAMLILASSLVGADINSGNLGTQLLFVPQRGRVFAARAVATVITATIVSVAMISIGLLGLWPIMKHFALNDADSHGNTRLLWGTSARGILLVLAVSLVGFSITWIVGHTAATIGIAGGWMIIVEQFIAARQQLSFLSPYSPLLNLIGIVEGHGSYYINTCTTDSSGTMCDSVEKTFSLTHALTVWGVILTLMLGAAFWLFNRRDVT